MSSIVRASENSKVQLITPAGDSAMDESLDAVRVNLVAGGGSGGTSMTDDAAFTPGSSGITPAGGTYRSVRDLVDDNDAGALAMTQRRALLTAIETPNGDSAMDDTNDAVRVNIIAGGGSGGTAMADKGAFTEGTTSFTPGGGVFNETITADPTEDQAAAVRITAKRAFHSNLRNNAGAETGVLATPLRVDPVGTTAQPVTDNSGSLTVDNPALSVTGGGVESGALRVTLANDSTGVISVDDNAGSLTVDGTVTSNQGTAAAGSGAWPVALTNTVDTVVKPGDAVNNAVRVNIVAGGGTGGVAQADKSAFTEGTTQFTPVGGVFNETITADPTEDQAAAARITAKRAIHVNLRDVAGNEVSVGGGTQYDEDTVHVTADKLTLAGAVRRDTAASGVDANGDRATINVDANGKLWTNTEVTVALPAGTNNIGDVDVLTLPVLPAGDNNIGNVDIVTLPATVHSADFDSGAGTDTKNAVGIIVPASGGAAVITGDVTNGLDVDVTRVQGTVTISGTVTANAGTGTLAVDSELPAAAALADAAANPTTPTVGSAALLFNGTTWDRQRGDTTNGLDVDVTRVGGNVTVVQSTAASLKTEPAGNVAHDAVDAGNPIKVGMKAVNAVPTVVSANNDRSDAIGDFYGQQFVRTDHVNLWSYHENSSSALTDTLVKAAPGAGLSIYVTDIVVSLGAATALNIFFEEGTTTTILGPFYLEAVNGRGLVISFKTPKKLTANTALNVTTSAAVAHSIDVTGFIAP